MIKNIHDFVIPAVNQFEFQLSETVVLPPLQAKVCRGTLFSYAPSRIEPQRPSPHISHVVARM